MIDSSAHSTRIQKTARILGFCLLLLVLLYFLLRKTETVTLSVGQDRLSLSYSGGDAFDIPFQEIRSVTEVQELDLGRYVSGADSQKFKFGVWQNDAYGQYRLGIYSNVKQYIVITTPADVYVLNLESADATHSFATAFTELLQTKQTQAAP